jgi:hypothetical protein
METQDEDESDLCRRARYFYLVAKRNFRRRTFPVEARRLMIILFLSEVCGIFVAVGWASYIDVSILPGNKHTAVFAALLSSYYATTFSFYPMWFLWGVWLHGWTFWKIGLADAGFFSVSGKCYEWLLHGLEQALGLFFLACFDSVLIAAAAAALVQMPIYLFLSAVICSPWFIARKRLVSS